MRHELAYTSAPRGLRSGTSGYSIVKMTAGMPSGLRELLEALSSYRHRSLLEDSTTGVNPTAFACLSAFTSGNRWTILSRVQSAKPDHTHRSNFYAHHVAIAGEKLQAFDSSQVFVRNALPSTWDSQTAELAACRPLTAGRESLRVCDAWKSCSGDAGWAGVVADHLLTGKRVYVMFAPGQPTLSLVSELVGLLPPADRWRLTYNTYFNSLPHGVDCQLRFVVADAQGRGQVDRQNSAVIDLTGQAGRVESNTPLVIAARRGQHAVAPAAVESAAVESGSRKSSPVMPDAKPRQFPASHEPELQATPPPRRVTPAAAAQLPASADRGVPRPALSPPLVSAPLPPATSSATPVIAGVIGAALLIIFAMGAFAWRQQGQLHELRETQVTLERELVAVRASSKAAEENAVRLAEEKATALKAAEVRLADELGRKDRAFETWSQGSTAAQTSLSRERDNLRRLQEKTWQQLVAQRQIAQFWQTYAHAALLANNSESAIATHAAGTTSGQGVPKVRFADVSVIGEEPIVLLKLTATIETLVPDLLPMNWSLTAEKPPNKAPQAWAVRRGAVKYASIQSGIDAAGGPGYLLLTWSKTADPATRQALQTAGSTIAVAQAGQPVQTISFAKAPTM